MRSRMRWECSRCREEGDDGIYRSMVIPNFWLRVDWLWADELPDPRLTFAEIANLPAQVIETLRQIKAQAG